MDGIPYEIRWNETKFTSPWHIPCNKNGVPGDGH